MDGEGNWVTIAMNKLSWHPGPQSYNLKLILMQKETVPVEDWIPRHPQAPNHSFLGPGKLRKLWKIGAHPAGTNNPYQLFTAKTSLGSRFYRKTLPLETKPSTLMTSKQPSLWKWFHASNNVVVGQHPGIQNEHATVNRSSSHWPIGDISFLYQCRWNVPWSPIVGNCRRHAKPA